MYPVPFGALTQLYAGTMGGKELNGKVRVDDASIHAFALTLSFSTLYLGPASASRVALLMIRP